MSNIPVEEIRRLEDVARRGDDLREFRESRMYGVLLTHIIEPMRQRAFNTFECVDASDQTAVIEVQMMKKIIDEIEKAVERGVNEGNLAKDTLSKVLP